MAIMVVMKNTSVGELVSKLKDVLTINELLASSISYCMWMLLLIWSASMTLMSHAEFFSSLCGSILIVFKLIFKQPITKFEIIATMVTLSGSIMLCFDSKAAKVD
jgi:hypothetical protein